MYQSRGSVAVCAGRPADFRTWVSSLPNHSIDSSVLPSLKRRYSNMAATATSSTASAAMAAAGGFDRRASTTSSLQTPGSGTFPSEMLSPMAHSPGVMRKEDALKTPITPPSAYLDFLRNLTPAMSPLSTGTSMRFNFGEKPCENTIDATNKRPAMISPPTSEPALSRNVSYESNNSNSTNASEQSATRSEPPMPVRRDSRPATPRIIIPPSHFIKPGPRSSRTPRRINIPNSPFSPALNSAATAPSPYTMSATPTSAAPWSASFSPREATDSPQTARVSVRHVVTRTITYCRTPLDPAPKGKRRKLAESTDSDAETPQKSAVTPVAQPLPQTQPTTSQDLTVKQEKLDEIEQTEDSCTETDMTDTTASEADTDASNVA